MAQAKESNAAVRRVCRILRVMQGHVVDGLSLTEIAKALKEPNASTVLRTLDAMAEETMVARLESGRWALSLLAIQIFAATSAEINRKSLRLEEFKQRIGAAH